MADAVSWCPSANLYHTSRNESALAIADDIDACFPVRVRDVLDGVAETHHLCPHGPRTLHSLKQRDKEDFGSWMSFCNCIFKIEKRQSPIHYSMNLSILIMNYIERDVCKTVVNYEKKLYTLTTTTGLYELEGSIKTKAIRKIFRETKIRAMR